MKQENTSKALKSSNYNKGHPWYYLLGGRVPTLKQIRADAIANSYHGYARHDIAQIDRRKEPQRSEELRALKSKFIKDLRKDISRHREIVRELRQYQQDNPTNESPRACADVHMAMSLKHAHIYNGFGHLHYLNELLSKQGDLFDF